MNNSGEHKRFHFTYKESVPAQSVKLWDVPALGFTNGSKVMIPAIRIGLEVNLELRKSSRKRTAQAVVRLVCSIRNRLVRTKYAQKGAVAIQWQLEQLGVRPLPAIWTINRILKREGLLVKPTYRPRSTPYPALQPAESSVGHQMDLVGPRYLKSKERFYGVHLIDVFSSAGDSGSLSKQARY